MEHMRVSSPRFVGRDCELAALAEMWHQAVAGTPEVVLVGGDAGVGKTGLVNEFASMAADAGARVLRGACLPLTDGLLPYGPIVGLLRSVPVTAEALPGLAPGLREQLAALVAHGPVESSDPGDGLRESGQSRLFRALVA